MRFFQYMVWVIMLTNMAFILLGYPDSINDYNIAINEAKNGFGNYSDHDLYKTFRYTDSMGVSRFEIRTDLARIVNEDTTEHYFLNDGFKIKDFYEYTNLGTRLVISKADYINLNIIGDWIFIFYRIIYLIVGILILLFIRVMKQGKIFSKQTMLYLQFVGVISILFGLLAPSKNELVEYLLKEFCEVHLEILPTTNEMYLGNSLYWLVGVFLLTIAFCFGRGNYLEKENDLTI